MSDQSPRDELASAYLDGVATPDERAAVDADAALLARVEDLRAVRRAVATPVPARPVADVDAAIAAALAVDGDDQGDPGAAVVALTNGGAGRRRRPVLLAAVGAAAAIAAIVAIAALRPSGDSTNLASDAPTILATERAGGGAATTAAGAVTTITASGSPSAAATTAVSPQTAGAASGVAALPALGTIDTDGDLRTALHPFVASGLSGADTATSTGCGVPGAVPVATVVWHGTPAVAFVEGATAVVVSAAGCTTLATVPLS